ncbi:MAG TPA: AmmeMemoRadiSam system protein B [Propionicimonas sp.]|uniref:AmmeMemoRadiSam system protein B n=1 Tax=Propionicimonas sp. TaxID=1955623 RepID=UPI002F3EEB09
MKTVRQPAVAGHFYPALPAVLGRGVDILLARARAATEPRPWPPKALIVPHAGYVYSGPTAARGFVLLDHVRDELRRVVLIGPAHHFGFAGVALSSAAAFATPLGEVALDHTLDSRLRGLPQVVDADRYHAPEHSLEVQLPFLQRVLSSFTLLPIVVGDATPQEVAAVVEACWGGPETVVVVSSDLSHYLPYDLAEARDRDTVQRILDLRWPLPDHAACGGRAIDGLLLAGGTHHLLPALVDRRNSGDAAGDRERVVGYAAVSFTETATREGQE